MPSNILGIVYYSKKEVAEQLGLSYGTISNLIKKGDLPSRRLGKLYRISISDLEPILMKLDSKAFEEDRIDQREIEAARFRKDIEKVMRVC